MSDAYETNFKWIDQIRDVRNPLRINALNSWLVEQLSSKKLDRIWMAPPVVVDWVKIKGFKYNAPKRGNLYDDLDTEDFLDSLGDKTVTLDILKTRNVHAIELDNEESFDHWTVYRCFYAEAPIGDSVFILNNGKWYEIAKSFTAEVQSHYENMPDSTLALPEYCHENEKEYNEYTTATLPGALCLDRKNIPYGGGHSKIEFCDVLTAQNQIVHVKRYSGSADLSHLFNQGVVAGELFACEPRFREKVNDKLPEGRKLINTEMRPAIEKYEIVFGIILPPDRDFDIPFFSKVSLRNARRRLQGYGYKVTKKGIKSTHKPVEANEEIAA